jgi:hypothetical protein
LYEKLVETELQNLTLPLEILALITDFENRKHRIILQAYLGTFVGEDRFECVFLISPQSTGSEAILGCIYAQEYGIMIDFVRKCLHYERDEVRKTQLFCQRRGIKAIRSDEMESNGQPTHNVTHIVQTLSILTETDRLSI